MLCDHQTGTTPFLLSNPLPWPGIITWFLGGITNCSYEPAASEGKRSLKRISLATWRACSNTSAPQDHFLPVIPTYSTGILPQKYRWGYNSCFYNPGLRHLIADTLSCLSQMFWEAPIPAPPLRVAAQGPQSRRSSGTQLMYRESQTFPEGVGHFHFSRGREKKMAGVFTEIS